MGTARSHDFNGEAASLAPNQLVGPTPHRMVINSGVSDTSLYHRHLQRRQTFLCLVTRRTGKAEENWRRLENPQNSGEANTTLNTEQEGAVSAACAGLSGVTPGELLPGQRQTTPSASSPSFVLKSNFFWRTSFILLSPTKSGIMGHFSHTELARHTHSWTGLPSHTGSFHTI